MNRLATFARVAGIVTVSMFIVLAIRTPSSGAGAMRAEPFAAAATPNAATLYLPAEYIEEENAASASELPAQF